MNQHPGLRNSLFRLFAVVLGLGLILALAHPAGAAAPGQGTVEPTFGRIYKAASRPSVMLGETLTFTIHLEAAWTATQRVSVTDPLPRGLEYVDGSATHGGVYDPATRSLAWTVTMSGTSTPLDLKFDVKDAAAVNQPTPVVNTATITFNGLILQRQAWVTLMPGDPGQGPLSGSFKAARPRLLKAGETVAYSIRLLNSGPAPITAQVVDPVPELLTYVPGSASHGGVYDPATRVVTWKDVLVPPYSPLLPVEPVTLTFAAQAPRAFVDITRPILVTNTAGISYGTAAIKRSVDILVVPHPYSPLEGSYKTASHRSVFPGQRFTYTITLHNSSPVPVPAEVSDPLPLLVSYVEGSANANGQYDPATRTLTWKDLTVLEGSSLALTFDVIVQNPVSADTASITNTAFISCCGITLRRSVTTPLQPRPVDPIPPVVQRFAIGEKDVYNQPEVELHIAATDNVGVRWMYLKEWVLASDPYPHWQPVNSSGWVRYQAHYPWKLAEQSGTHTMAVWVADAARNRSRLTPNAIDFASLLLPGAKVDGHGLIPYLVYYPAGVEVTARLETTLGLARLFAWYPGSLFAPDEASPTPASSIQIIQFTTRSAGIYLFLVYGVEPSVFNLSITPGGGPRLPTLLPYGATVPEPGGSIGTAADAGPADLDAMAFNPILPQSGLDPLDSAEEPGDPPAEVFLPVVIH